MKLITIQDIFNTATVAFEAMGSLKDAFASALLSNVNSSFGIFIGGSWIVGGVLLILSLIMAWRLKGWVISILSEVLFRH